MITGQVCSRPHNTSPGGSKTEDPEERKSLDCLLQLGVYRKDL